MSRTQRREPRAAARELSPAEEEHRPVGKPLKVVKLPMPAPVYFDGQRLPASYANFYIANKLVLVPVFNDPNDRVALNTLAELFPERKSWASTAATSSGDWARCTA